MKLFTLVFLSLSIIGCSSKLKKKNKEDIKDHGIRNEKLLESFQVDQDVMEKFKVEKKPKSQMEKDKVTVIKENKAVRTTIRPKPQKLNFEKKKNKTIASIETKSIYPPDYPDKLIKINKITEEFWKDFSPRVYPGEKTKMDINYMGVSTGSITISVNEMTQVADEQAYFLNARVKTAKYYSYLYELDDNIDSYVSVKDFSPVKYSLIQRESGQDIDDLQLFDSTKFKNLFFYKRVTKEKNKKRQGNVYIPQRFQDPLSIIFFLRGLPMRNGDVYNVPIVNKEKVILFNTKIAGVEKIQTKLGERSAIKMVVSTKYTGDTLKSGDMTFWFSNDEKRIFLKFNAKIKIGSISGDIEQYELK